MDSSTLWKNKSSLVPQFCFCFPTAPPHCLILQNDRSWYTSSLVIIYARLYSSSAIHKLTKILNLETEWCPAGPALGKKSWMSNPVTQLDVFANPKSCDLWARHVGPEEELTLGCITGFFHQRIIAGRQVTKSKHILLSREYHQRQKQIPAGKKESLAHSPSHVSPQRCWWLEAVSIMIAQTDDNAL